MVRFRHARRDIHHGNPPRSGPIGVSRRGSQHPSEGSLAGPDILLTADGIGTNGIVSPSASRNGHLALSAAVHPAVVHGLAHDKTRPSRITASAETIDRVIALTNADPPHEATHWTAAAMAKAGRQPLLGATHLEGARACPTSGASFKPPTIRSSPRS